MRPQPKFKVGERVYARDAKTNAVVSAHVLEIMFTDNTPDYLCRPVHGDLCGCCEPSDECQGAGWVLEPDLEGVSK